MEILDSIEEMRALDKSGMYDKIFSFPEQIEQAFGIGNSISIDASEYKETQNIIVAGMGGSAIGGDLVRSYLQDDLNIPFHVCRNYTLPAFADNKTLVIVSSYSGNTEETLSALNMAIEKDCRVICLTSGGQVGQLADKNNYPKAVLPEGYPPRSALGFSFFPLLMIMQKLGFCPDQTENIKEVANGLKSYRIRYASDTHSEHNPAKKLAVRLHNKVPIIYSGPDRLDAVGTRWKGQICENAEMLAFSNVFPEFNHNELVGWNILGDFRNSAVVVYLRDAEDNNRIKARMDAVKNILEKEKIDVIDVFSHGDFRLGSIFSLIQLGDFASFYLAMLNGVDPTPVTAIDHLKNELSKI